MTQCQHFSAKRFTLLLSLQKIVSYFNDEEQ
jgi:hypothetical protein